MFPEDTDDTAIHACGPKNENVTTHLEDALKIVEWFPNNFMKLNEDKCHLMSEGGNNEI